MNFIKKVSILSDAHNIFATVLSYSYYEYLSNGFMDFFHIFSRKKASHKRRLSNPISLNNYFVVAVLAGDQSL